MTPSSARSNLSIAVSTSQDVPTYKLLVFDLSGQHQQSFESLAEEFECSLEYHQTLQGFEAPPQAHDKPSKDLVYIILPDESVTSLQEELALYLTPLTQLSPYRVLVVPHTISPWYGCAKALAIHHLLSSSHSAFLDQLYQSLSLFHRHTELVSWDFQQENKGWQWWSIQSTEDILNYSKQTIERLNPILSGRSNELQTTLFEALTNAVYHAPRHRNGDEKYHKAQPITYLPAKDRAFLGLKQLTHSASILVQDQWGTLKLEQIWQWMEENTREDALFATHGRGFFLMYLLMDGLQVDMAPQTGTRVTFHIQQTPSEEDAPYKPLFLNVCV